MMATDNLIQALAKKRTLGDWSQQYRPLLNPPSRSAALSQVLRAPGIASGGIYGGDRGGGQREVGYDPNQGAGVSNLSFWEGIKAYGPNVLAVAGGPVGMLSFGARKAFRAVVDAGDRAAAGRAYERGVDAQEAYAGNAMRAYERDYGGARNGGDRNGGSRRDRDRAGLGGDPNQSGPR